MGATCTGFLKKRREKQLSERTKGLLSERTKMTHPSRLTREFQYNIKAIQKKKKIIGTFH
jgi:hypothetical protein